MHLGFTIFNFVLAVLCLLYVVRRINWLLIEKEEELCYRSLKIGPEVLKTEGDEESDLKVMVERRLDMIGNNIKGVIPGKKDTISSNNTYNKRNQLF